MLKYVCGSSKEEICLSQANIRTRIRTAGFYDSDWDVEDTKQDIGRSVEKLKKDAISYKMTVDFLGSKEERADNANQLFELTERDVLNRTPGRLYLNDYYVECYIIGRESGGRDNRVRAVQVVNKVYVPHPFWIREEIHAFRSYDVTSEKNKRYKGKYPYRYANGIGGSYINNPHFWNANFKMIIYGPVANPQISIGGNTYLVNIILEEGEYLEIDSRSKTIQKVLRNGEKEDAFHNRQKGKEFFRKIQHGRQAVLWTGKFDFDIVIFEERSEPKWSS